ncbi:MAG: acetate/propionate family kinase [Spirochaetales bacterium]|nr:acetate/propionate family kinase [Spirochaetales bacterium]
MLMIQFQIDTLSFWEYRADSGEADIICTYKRKASNDLTQAFTSFSKIFSECSYNSTEDILVTIPLGPANYPSLSYLDEKYIRDVEEYIHNQPMYFRELLVFLEHIHQLEPNKRIAILSDNGFFQPLIMKNPAFAVPPEIQKGHKMVFRGIHGARHQRVRDKLGDKANFISIVLDKVTSLVAVKGGELLLSSTGYSLFEGIMGLTNCGDIDPGIILYLLKEKGYSMFEIDDMLKKKSGFKGFLSEAISAPESLKYLALTDSKLQLAFDIFRNQLLKYIGQSFLNLGRVDSIVVSGDFLPAFYSFTIDLLEHISFAGISLRENKCRPPDSKIFWEVLTRDNSKITVLFNHESLSCIWGKVAAHRGLC